MHASAERAVDASRRLGDAPLTAAALADARTREFDDGGAERAEADHLEADGALRVPFGRELARHLEAGARLAGMELYLDRYAEADAHASRSLAVARATGQGEQFLVQVAILGGVLRQRGDWSSRRVARRWDRGRAVAGQLHALGGAFSAVPPPRCGWATWSSPLQPRRRASISARTPARSFHSAEGAADLAAALLEWANRNVQSSCWSARRAAMNWCSSPGAPEPGSSRCWRVAGSRSNARPRRDEPPSARRPGPRPCAGRWLSRGPDERRRPSTSTPVIRLVRPRARSSRRPPPTRSGRRSRRAFSRLLSGRALAQAGDRHRAVDELPRAAHDFEGVGALRYCGTAERELRKLGHRVQNRTRPGGPAGTAIESLTERELQLTMLVVDRKTNPEIADELFLSQKTVETHLRNIFRKVDVSTRVELARAVERAQRATGTRS